MRFPKIVIALAALLAVGTSAGAPAQDGPQASAEATAEDRVLGQADAPVTIIEYASLTCPHCATFHAETLPRLKAEWIEPGKAKLVYRHYPLDRLALRAAMAAECLQGPRYFSFLDLLFRQQRRWAGADDPIAAIGKLAGMAGLGPERFRACVQDEATARAILETQIAARNTFDVTSTPSFVIDGETISGAQPYRRFESLLERLYSQS